MHALLADDGIWRGNFDIADVLLIVATFLFLVAAACAVPRGHVDHTRTGDTHHHVEVDARRWTWPFAFVAFALTAFALALW